MSEIKSEEKTVVYRGKEISWLEVVERLTQDGLEIEFVKHPTKELQLIAIEQNVLAIMGIKQPKREVMLRALQLNKGVVKLIPKDFQIKNVEEAKVFVSLNGLMLQFVSNRNRTKEVCRIAFNQTINAFEFIPLKQQEPYMAEAVLEEDITKFETISDTLKTPELCLKALRYDQGRYIKRIPPKILTQAFYRQAIQVNPLCIKFIEKKLRTPELCELAFSLDPRTFKFLPHYTSDMCLVAIEFEGKNIQHVSNPTDEMILLAANCCHALTNKMIMELSEDVLKKVLAVNAHYIWALKEPVAWEIVEYGMNQFVSQMDKRIKEGHVMYKGYFRLLSVEYPDHKDDIEMYYKKSLQKGLELVEEYEMDEAYRTIFRMSLDEDLKNVRFGYWLEE